MPGNKVTITDILPFNRTLILNVGGQPVVLGFSAANGVAYACSADPVGHMYALDTATGGILWSFVSGGACNAGAAISNGTVYWGSGYRQFFTGNNKVYAFTLP